MLLDEQSLEVHGLHIALNTNHWKRSPSLGSGACRCVSMLFGCSGRKTFLKECILPGVWDNFKLLGCRASFRVQGFCFFRLVL